MEHLQNEEEQLEKIREWWDKYGKSVIAGVIAAIVVAVSVQSWRVNQRAHNETASAEYSQLLQYMESDRSKAGGLAERIVTDYGDTAYGSMAALLQARMAAEQGNWDQAAAQLSWVVDNSDDEGMRHIARLRLGRVLLQQDKTDAALALVKGVEQESFTAEYEELLGDIYLQSGDRDKARAAYAKALVVSAISGNNRMLKMKLDDLAVASKDAK